MNNIGTVGSFHPTTNRVSQQMVMADVDTDMANVDLLTAKLLKEQLAARMAEKVIISNEVHILDVDGHLSRVEIFDFKETHFPEAVQEPVERPKCPTTIPAPPDEELVAITREEVTLDVSQLYESARFGGFGSPPVAKVG